MAEEQFEEKPKEEANLLMRILLWPSITILLFIPYLFIVDNPSLLITVGCLGLAIVYARFCFGLAQKIKGNLSLAYFLGAIFGLFAILGYWIRLKIIYARQNAQKKTM